MSDLTLLTIFVLVILTAFNIYYLLYYR